MVDILHQKLANIPFKASNWGKTANWQTETLALITVILNGYLFYVR